MKNTTYSLDCEIRVTKYGALVLIEYLGSAWPKDQTKEIVLTYSDYQKVIGSTRKLEQNPRLLVIDNIPTDRTVNRHSVQYMRNYLNGNWNWVDGMYLSPKRYLTRGDFSNFYMGYAGNNGYIRHLDGKVVSRKIDCEFWASSYDTVKLAIGLEACPQFSDIVFNDDVCWANVEIVGRHYLHAKYEPAEGELDKLAKRKGREYPFTDIGGSHGHIHDVFSFIAECKRPKDY